MTQQILLIDDDPVINFVNTKIVAKKFTDTPIFVFEDGKKALEHIKTNSTHSFLIFLDLNMPNINGWEFLDAISLEACDFNIQVHIVTSSVDPSDRAKAAQYKQVLTYLVKPLKASHLDNLTGI